MKTIINNLFHQIGLLNKEVDGGVLHFFEEDNKYSYWLVIETDNLTEVIENQLEYFNISKEVANNEWFDKNVSMIILHKVENFDNIQNLVIEIEENPYLFKKQIILYKNTEVEKLNQSINSQEIRIKDFIENKILDEETFKIHKKYINNNDYESLLYRLAHKIPFIKLCIIQENGLEALTVNNRQKIETVSFGELNNFIDQNVFNRSVESIDEMSPDIIYDFLLSTLNSDEN
ncbi:MAG: ABC-three component system middle component 1 [Lutibacter sp.]